MLTGRTGALSTGAGDYTAGQYCVFAIEPVDNVTSIEVIFSAFDLVPGMCSMSCGPRWQRHTRIHTHKRTRARASLWLNACSVAVLIGVRSSVGTSGNAMVTMLDGVHAGAVVSAIYTGLELPPVFLSTTPQYVFGMFHDAPFLCCLLGRRVSGGRGSQIEPSRSHLTNILPQTGPR